MITETLEEFGLDSNPFRVFARWFEEASHKEINDPNAMSLATVDAHGHPSVRIVLLKFFDESGFCFYTNTQSRKGQEIDQNSKVCLNFHWKSLQRQVRIYGETHRVPDQEADVYFANRPVLSQIGAWASQQSRPLESRKVFEEEIERYKTKFAEKPVPRPPHWTGFRVVPTCLEFWQEHPFRLHDRFVYTAAPAGWIIKRLYP